MPRTTKTAVGGKAAQPQLSAELLEQFISGPVPGPNGEIFSSLKLLWVESIHHKEESIDARRLKTDATIV